MRRDFNEARRSEVGDLQQTAFRDEHVARTQIAMDDTLLMRVIERVADLAGIVQRSRQVDLAVARDDGLERVARHVLHDDEEDVLLLFRRQDGNDVRMAERGEQSRLPQQVAEVDVLPMGNLDGDFLVNPGVFGEVHRAEAATTKRREDLVLSNRLTTKKHAGSIQVKSTGAPLLRA